MLKDQQTIIPDTLADRLTTWWMKRIKEFDSVATWPCKRIEINGCQNNVLCKPHEATMWPVYGYKPVKDQTSGASLELLAQFSDPAGAERFCQRLRTTYSHLDKERTKRRPAPRDQPIL